MLVDILFQQLTVFLRLYAQNFLIQHSLMHPSDIPRLDPEQQQQLQQVQRAAEEEIKHNEERQLFHVGRPLRVGQPFQLLHIQVCAGVAGLLAFARACSEELAHAWRHGIIHRAACSSRSNCQTSQPPRLHAQALPRTAAPRRQRRKPFVCA